MDDDIEDLVGDVMYTDSSKSPSTSIVYSYDFSDSSPERNDSSDKETYIVDYDVTDSEDTDKTYYLHLKRGDTDMTLYQQAEGDISRFGVNLHADTIVVNKYTETSVHKCSMVAQETYTQTSKTIIELAENDGLIPNRKVMENLQTQTSIISITENKTVQYKIELADATNKNVTKLIEIRNARKNSIPSLDDALCERYYETVEENLVRLNSVQSRHNICNFNVDSDDDCSESNTILNDSLTLNVENEEDFSVENKEPCVESESYLCDFQEPILMEKEIQKLYKSALNTIQNKSYISKESSIDNRKFATLTPVTEESTAKSFVDITPKEMAINTERSCREVKLDYEKICSKTVEDNALRKSNDMLKLPPIKTNFSCPSSPHLGLFFANNLHNRPLSKSGTLPCQFKSDFNYVFNNDMNVESSPMASGENADMCGFHDQNIMFSKDVHLPPINYKEHGAHGGNNSARNRLATQNISKMFYDPQMTGDNASEPICITEKIKRLKTINKHRYSSPSKDGRSPSPTSSPGSEIAERTCDGLCVELLKRLRSQSWIEVVETLDGVPKSLEKFWQMITENRIADLLRQVASHVESPRTQVAKSACATIAIILQNTNYVKKPDFYEAMSILLNKTGSLSRPVRRAANLALDSIVCGVDVTHAVAAVCIHGVSHKSGLVRSASARLLVVSAALAQGGRSLLRSRPASAATARQYLLRSLSTLLDDKNNDTRKFAERLFGLLRPLHNFEAYFLNDVSLEIATKQMRKHDKLNTTSESKPSDER